MLRTLYFLALMLTAIAMALALAHLFELPNKIDIGANDYLIVQRNYDSWSVIGLVVPLAFLAVLALTLALRGTGAPYVLAAIALVLLVGELSVFWGLIFPVNQATETGRFCPTIGKHCGRNGNTRTRQGRFSTFWRSAHS
jgi:hypothetical protein